MIKIIQGIYGYKSVNGTIEPKTSKDAPFSLTAEQEERLVKKGVAEYVEVAPVQQDQEEASEGELEEELESEEDLEEESEDRKIDKEQLQKMKYNDLKHLAKELGINASGNAEELIEKIAETMVKAEEEGEETPPVLTPAEPQ